MLKRNIIIILLLIVSSLYFTGCGGSDKAFKDAMLQSFIDGESELTLQCDIEAALFYGGKNIPSTWRVKGGDKGEDKLGERITNLIKHKCPDFNKYIKVNKAYYIYQYDHNCRGYVQEIQAHCTINEQFRRIIIDCGKTEVTYTKHLKSKDRWYVSVADQNNVLVSEPWSNCYYEQNEIAEHFRDADILFASYDYMIIDNGIYLFK